MTNMFYTKININIDERYGWKHFISIKTLLNYIVWFVQKKICIVHERKYGLANWSPCKL